jgi:hypothetical protein
MRMPADAGLEGARRFKRRREEAIQTAGGNARASGRGWVGPPCRPRFQKSARSCLGSRRQRGSGTGPRWICALIASLVPSQCASHRVVAMNLGQLVARAFMTDGNDAASAGATGGGPCDQPGGGAKASTGTPARWSFCYKRPQLATNTGSPDIPHKKPRVLSETSQLRTADRAAKPALPPQVGRARQELVVHLPPEMAQIIVNYLRWAWFNVSPPGVHYPPVPSKRWPFLLSADGESVRLDPQLTPPEAPSERWPFLLSADGESVRLDPNLPVDTTCSHRVHGYSAMIGPPSPSESTDHPVEICLRLDPQTSWCGSTQPLVLEVGWCDPTPLQQPGRLGDLPPTSIWATIREVSIRSGTRQAPVPNLFVLDCYPGDIIATRWSARTTQDGVFEEVGFQIRRTVGSELLTMLPHGYATTVTTASDGSSWATVSNDLASSVRARCPVVFLPARGPQDLSITILS